MTHMMKFFFVWLCSAVPVAAMAAEPVFFAECEIARSADVSKIELFIVNRHVEVLRLGTAKDHVGGPRGFVPVQEGKGSGATNVMAPRLRFSFGED
jgi:hypothetical protein